jgi:hypothetical protein
VGITMCSCCVFRQGCSGYLHGRSQTNRWHITVRCLRHPLGFSNGKQRHFTQQERPAARSCSEDPLGGNDSQSGSRRADD